MYHTKVLAELPDKFNVQYLNWQIHNYDGKGAFTEPDDRKFFKQLADEVACRKEEARKTCQMIIGEDVPVFSSHDDVFMLKSLDWLDDNGIELSGGHSVAELRLQLLIHSGMA